jgi:hypothetical protein
MRWALLLSLMLLGCSHSPPGYPPEAMLRAPSTCDLGKLMTLDASASSDLDGDIILYRFVVADGTAGRETAEPVVTVPCRVAGLIEVMVEVEDAQGNTAQAGSVVSVRRP